MNAIQHLRSITIQKQKPALFLTTGLLILLLLNACGPAAAPVADTPTEIPNTPTQVLPTPTTEASPTPVPEETQVYPYYLPLAAKLDIPPQTIDGVTTQIDWAYADEGRVALHYTISSLDWPDGTYMDPMQQVGMTSEAVPDLWMGAVSGNRTLVEQGVITSAVDQRLVEGALDPQKTPEIRLNVEIPVEGPTKVGTFRFKFDLPVLPGTRIENIEQTVVANNVSMTLKEIWMTPSYVEALFCFQMPSAVDWGLTASRLTVGDREYTYSSGGLMPGAEGKDFRLTDPERCSSIGFDVVQDETAESLTLTVPRLVGSYPEVVDQERVNRANQRLADSGVEFQYVNIDHGGNIEAGGIVHLARWRHKPGHTDR